MSNLRSKKKPDKSKSPPPLTICYTNVRGLRGTSQNLKHLCSRTSLISFLSVKPTYMRTYWTLMYNCLATCQSIERILGTCTDLVFMLRVIFRLLGNIHLRTKKNLLCVFVWHFCIPPLTSSSYMFAIFIILLCD